MAQAQAATAIGQWNSGQASHQAACDTLADARSRLDSAGKSAAAMVGGARDLAPPKPSFWSHIGSLAADLGHDAKTVGLDVINGFASFGNAAINHPGELAAAAGGAALTTISAAGDGLGVALDATGIGALAGGPLNAVSTVGVAAGAGITGTALGAIAKDAAGPDHVSLMNSNDSPAGSGGGGDAPAGGDARDINFLDRASARQAFDGDARTAANRFFRGATSKSTNFQAQNLGNGQYKMQFLSPANNPGYGKLYVQEIDSSGTVLKEYKDTLGPDGLVERKWLVGGPP